MRAPEARAKILGILCRRAVFLAIWNKKLLKLWTFLLGRGGAGAPSAPPLATGLWKKVNGQWRINADCWNFDHPEPYC